MLVHCAAQTGGLRVSEDELLAEGRLVADEDWQAQFAERGVLSPGPLAEKLDFLAGLTRAPPLIGPTS